MHQCVYPQGIASSHAGKSFGRDVIILSRTDTSLRSNDKRVMVFLSSCAVIWSAVLNKQLGELLIIWWYLQQLRRLGAWQPTVRLLKEKTLFVPANKDGRRYSWATMISLPSSFESQVSRRWKAPGKTVVAEQIIKLFLLASELYWFCCQPSKLRDGFSL